MTSVEINKLFRDKGFTLGSVESFTGGSFASSITSISGASHFFKGALITYATEEKNRILSLPYEMIDKYGVVSAEIAGEMASRGRALLNVDYCVSFTGNAGPSTMEDKPVGLIYIGICYEDKAQVFTYHLTGNRESIQKQAIDIAYEILGKILTKKEQTPTIK